jgi:hypothetical protein
MEEGLIYTDSRPRAKSTGHAFGFEGNLGMVLIVAAMVSVFILTMLFHANNPLPIPAKFMVAALPTLIVGAYLIVFRHRRPPRYDLDLLTTLVNGRSFHAAKHQPVHPIRHVHD